MLLIRFLSLTEKIYQLDSTAAPLTNEQMIRGEVNAK